MSLEKLGDWFFGGLAVVCVLLAIGLLVVVVGALVGFVPTSEPTPCQVQQGGTGKTSGFTENFTGTLRGDNGSTIRCVGGEQR